MLSFLHVDYIFKIVVICVFLIGEMFMAFFSSNKFFKTMNIKNLYVLILNVLVFISDEYEEFVKLV